MKTKMKLLIIFGLLIVVLIFQGLKDFEAKMGGTLTKSTFQDLYWNMSYVDAPSQSIHDGAIYGDDQQDVEVEKLYVTILPTQDEVQRSITFKALNSFEDFRADIPTLNAQVAINDKNGLDQPNASITLRGHSTLGSEQKSYKLKLNSDAQVWYGQKTINLSKHPFDDFRVRNKIAFDLFEHVPDFTSMKTKFIQLFVKDLSEGNEGKFIDYGIFTSIEQPDKAFLKAHQLDENGALYKSNYFEFFTNDEDLKNSDDQDYDEVAFESHLEINSSTSHDKLIKMLEDVNNVNLDIDSVLNKHFNRDNYFTWLAVNILLGNYDTQTQNYFLYSPHDALTWYFLPWDYDGSMNSSSDLQYDADRNYVQLIGVSNYWNAVLHSRVFTKPHNLVELNAKIEEVYKILNDKLLQQELNKYLPILKEFFLTDEEFNEEVSLEQFYLEIRNIGHITSQNREKYYETLEKPMPIFLGNIEKVENGYLLLWDDSYDLQGDELSYTLQISHEPNFSSLIFDKKELTATNFIVELSPGDYFWRVIVTDAKGNTQRAFDPYDAGDYNFYYGLKKITID